MFGRGNKKSAADRQQWNLMVLTTSYLIEGSVQPEDFEVGDVDMFALAAGREGLTGFERLRLSSARVRPTGNLAAPEQTFAEWGMTVMDEVVAIAPWDPNSLKVAQAAFKDYRHPLPVVVHSGPYRLQATLLADTADRDRSPFAMTPILPLSQATIDCLLPGAKLAGFQVPWLLLNGSALLHGYGLV